MARRRYILVEGSPESAKIGKGCLRGTSSLFIEPPPSAYQGKGDTGGWGLIKR